MRRPAWIIVLAGWAGTTVRAHEASSTGPSGDGSLEWWLIEWWVIAPVVLIGLVYLCGIGRLWRAAGVGRGVSKIEATAFIGAWSILVIAVGTPLDALASRLFSVHMLQHELLMVAVAPLMVLSRPLPVLLWALSLPARRHVRSWISASPLNRGWQFLTVPWIAWLMHAAALWIWHAPVLFNMALADRALHALQHTSFLVSALLFWWTILGPRRAGDKTGPALLSLFTTMLHTGVLGALLTFSASAWFVTDVDLAMSVGLTALQDQQLGGLIMWVPAGLVYPIVAVWLVWRTLGPESVRRPTLRAGARAIY